MIIKALYVFIYQSNPQVGIMKVILLFDHKTLLGKEPTESVSKGERTFKGVDQIDVSLLV